MRSLVISLLLSSSAAKNLALLDDSADIFSGLEEETTFYDQRNELLEKYREKLRGYDLADDIEALDSDAPKCKAHEAMLNHPSNSKEYFDKVISGKAKWQDPLFKGDQNSLWAPDRDRPYRFEKVTAWKSPAEIDTNRKPRLFGNWELPRPQGISQGQVGDCWFLAAASAVAEDPKRIVHLIDEKNIANPYNEAGIFRFSFYKMSKKITVNIDDRLPVFQWRKGGNYHLFATQKSEAHAWWMPLMEKAYAKFNQNYDRIQGGSFQESLRQLTNMPTFRLPHSRGRIRKGLKEDPDKSWKLMQHLAGKNHPISSSCCNGNTLGLVGGHAYTVLDTIEVKDAGKTHRLMKMRNPWATEKYEGPFSDKSDLWTPALKKQAGWTDANDGVFFMKFEDWLNLFWASGVSVTENFGHTQYWEFKQSKWGQGIRINNPVKQKFIITVESNRWSRLYPHGCVKNEWINFKMYGPDRKQVDPPGCKYIGNGITHDTIGDVAYETEYPAGQYFIWMMNQQQKRTPGFKIDYIVQIYQEKSEESAWIKLDHKLGKKSDVVKDVQPQKRVYHPDSPHPDSKEAKELQRLAEEQEKKLEKLRKEKPMHGSNVLSAAQQKSLASLFPTGTKFDKAFDAKDDGYGRAGFEAAVYNKGKTVHILESSTGAIIGGVVPANLKNQHLNMVDDPNTFLFYFKGDKAIKLKYLGANGERNEVQKKAFYKAGNVLLNWPRGIIVWENTDKQRPDLALTHGRWEMPNGIKNPQKAQRYILGNKDVREWYGMAAFKIHSFESFVYK